MSKTFPKKIGKSCDVSFSSAFFGDGSSKTLQKTFYKNNRVERLLQKKIDPKVQHRLFLDFFNHVFWRFSVRGVQKHDKKNIERYI
jgi:hypothetical protein